MNTYSAIRTRMTRGNYIPTDRSVLWAMSKGRCFWCDSTMNLRSNVDDPVGMTVDHINVKNSGMPRDLLKVAACLTCNRERGALPADLYWLLWACRLAGIAA